MAEKSEMEITIQGNPAKPQGEQGAQMLARMNQSHDALTRWALGFLHTGEDAVLLDIGCGGGATLQKLEKRTRNHVYGVDYAALSVAQSAALNREAVHAGKMQVLEASVSALPFEDDFFDGITTVESFYFWPAHESDLKEVYRVLKRSGTFMIVADIYEKPDVDASIRENIERFGLFNPTPKEFETLLLQAGFRDVNIHLKEGTHWICAEGKK